MNLNFCRSVALVGHAFLNRSLSRQSFYRHCILLPGANVFYLGASWSLQSLVRSHPAEQERRFPNLLLTSGRDTFNRQQVGHSGNIHFHHQDLVSFSPQRANKPAENDNGRPLVNVLYVFLKSDFELDLHWLGYGQSTPVVTLLFSKQWLNMYWYYSIIDSLDDQLSPTRSRAGYSH